MRVLRKLLWVLPVFALFSVFLYGRKSETSKTIKETPKVTKQETTNQRFCDPCEKPEQNYCDSCEEPEDYCYDPCEDPCMQKAKTRPYDMGYAICEGDLPKAYNTPARIDICDGVDAFVMGSFIYWEPLIDQNDIGILETTTASANTFEILELKDKYDPGFKLAFGFYFSDDDWDFITNYTRVHGSVSSSFDPSTKPGATFYTSWLLSAPPLALSTITTNLDASWKRDLDKLDFELGRSCYVGKQLIFRPYIGGSVHWLDQKYSLNYTTTALFDLTWKASSWAIGPRVGLNVNWLFFKNFRVFSKLSIDLDFASNKTSASGAFGSTAISALSYKKYIIRDVEELELGLGCGTYFSHNKWHFDLSIAYEAQRYANVNYMNKYANMYVLDSDTPANASSTMTKPGDLYYHGLTLRARLDF